MDDDYDQKVFVLNYYGQGKKNQEITYQMPDSKIAHFKMNILSYVI